MGAWKQGERRKCSACGKECVGAKSKHGPVGPIELEPNDRGNVLLFKDAKGELRYAVLPGGGAVPGAAKAEAAKHVQRWIRENFMVLRMNHFATCPEAERFHRRAATTTEES